MPDIPIPAINECAIAFDIDDGKFIFISSGVSLVLGYIADDFYKNNKLPHEIIHPGDNAEVKLITDNVTEDKFVELNYRIITADGEVKRVHEKRDLIVNKDNGHKISFSIIKEQPAGPAESRHERTVSEKLDKIGIAVEIKKTTKKLDTFIESVTDAFFLLDQEWRFVKVNAAFEQIFNKTREEVTGRLLPEVFPGIQSTNFAQACRIAISENEMMKFTACIEPLNKWFDTTVYPSPEGITIFAKNITDEKRVMEELIWTKNSLEGVLNNTEDQIWSVDKELNYVYINKAYRNRLKMLGVEPKEGEPFQNTRRSQAITNKWKKFYDRAFKGGVFTIVDKGIDPTTKGLLNFEISFHPIINSDKIITGVGCLAKNITQRLKTEKAIVEQNGRLRLIASLTSHELRRPVASLLGLLNIIDRTNIYNPDNFEIMDHLFTVGNEIDEVIRLIINETFTDDLLNEDYKKT